MSRVIKQETDATASTTGVWTVSVPWGVSGGSAKYTTAVGATFTWTLPANHGYTGATILGYGLSAGTTNASIQVDGVTVIPVWSQKFATLIDPNYYQPRICSLPITLNPAKGTTQTVTLTGGTDGGSTYADAIELYTAEAPVAGLLTSFGHSMLYGVTSAADGAARTTTRFSKLFANILGTQSYLGSAAWTDDNQGVPAEDLANGSYYSGSIGGGATTATPQFTNQRYYNPTGPWTPGWMRAESGDLWAAFTTANIPGVGPSMGGSGCNIAGS